MTCTALPLSVFGVAHAAPEGRRRTLEFVLDGLCAQHRRS